MSFIDDYIRVSWIYLHKSKNDVRHIIPQFSKMIATQFNTQVKAFHFDNGREFVNQSLVDLFKENRILHQTHTYMPQQNDIAKRKTHHILKASQALCFTMHVLKRF